MKCFFTLDEKTGERVFIPMCYGSLHQDDLHTCTCPDPLTEHHFQKEKFNEILKEKNESIAAMQSELEHLRKILKIINAK